MAPCALAGAAAPYGEHFVRVGESWPDGGPTLSLPGPVELPPGPDGENYQSQLGRLEREGGPYADGLAEPLAGLARLYRRGGDIERAVQAYQRALHIIRVNDGLYSERQVPVLKELFETYRLSGDMAMLDARYDYFFRLYGSGQPPYSAVRLGAALEYMRWQREAVRMRLDSDDTERLSALYTLNQNLLDAVADDPTVGFAQFRAIALSQIRNLYLVQNRYEPKIDSIGVPSNTALGSAWTEQDVQQHRLETIQRSALNHGRELIEEVIARTPPEQVGDMAGAYLELADWNQWNDRRPEALSAYGKVVELLQESGKQDLLLQWFGQPVELPANGAFWQSHLLAEGAEPVVLQARYDVSATGRAGNIQVTALAAENEGKTAKLRRDLSRTRFRPRFVLGQPEPELQVERDYELLN